MLLMGVLVLATVPTQGTLKFTLDQHVMVASDSAMTLEVSVGVPFGSMLFVRSDRAYVAQVRISVRATDRHRQPVAGDVILAAAVARTYESTTSRDSMLHVDSRLSLPSSAVRVRVDVSDRNSDRAAWATFEPVRHAGRAALRMMKSGRPWVRPRYGLSDTVQAVMTAVQLPADSVRFVLQRRGRATAEAVRPLSKHESEVEASFSFAVADSSCEPRLRAGDYVLVVTPAGGKARELALAVAELTIELPFFLDDSSYEERVTQLLYVASADEMRTLKSRPLVQRDSAWRAFWKPLDPIPATELNEWEVEYFERVAHCIEHFGRPDQGLRSDRARVYMKYGAPDQIDSRPFESDRPSQEVWHYFERGVSFTFSDRFGWGEFVLTTPGFPNGW